MKRNFRMQMLGALISLLGLLILAGPPINAQTLTTLDTFTNTGSDGAFPRAGLIIDSQGNLYGTTLFGGVYGWGTVFELVNSSGTYSLKILYSFANEGSGGDGAEPNAGLIMDSQGNLYGTTTAGGTNGQGTVFELVSSSGAYTEKVLHSFTFAPGDGAQPQAGLIMDSQGNLYGTTMGGGTNSAGTVFELVNSSGTYTEKLLHNFTAGSGDGYGPLGSLIMDSQGNLYGTTLNGGVSNFGTVFELANSSGTYTEKVLQSFNAANGGDGGNPVAGLLMDSQGNLFGTTTLGTVFELVNSSGTYSEKVLHTFTENGVDGVSPGGSLIMDSQGNLYGTTTLGGVSGQGTVFELVNSSGIYTEIVLISFGTSCSGGLQPRGGVVLDTSGNLFGATNYGGSLNNAGTVFKLSNLSGPASPTAVTGASSENPAAAGDLVMLTASVTSSLGPVNSGTVSFFSGATPLGTAQPVTCGTAGAVSVEDALSLGIGTRPITLQYTPAIAAFAPSASTFNETVTEPGVAVTNGSNTFSGNQTVNGTVSASGFAGNGSALTNLNPANLAAGTAAINITGNAATAGVAGSAANATNASNSANLAGVPAASYARLDLANNFTGNQNVSGNLAISGNSATTGTLSVGGGTPIKEHLSATFSPAFAALKPGECATASFTFAAAVDGDTIALGVPASRMAGGGNLVYTAWVSSANTVTIQVCNVNASVPQKTAGSGAIRVDLWQH